MASFEEMTAPASQGFGREPELHHEQQPGPEQELALAEETLAAPEPQDVAAGERQAPAEPVERQAPAEPHAQPQPQALAHQVPLPTYLQEREQRQELQRQLYALRVREMAAAAEKPDPFLDPDRFTDLKVQAALAPIQQQFAVHMAHANKAMAVAAHDAALVERAQAEFDRAFPVMHPAEQQRVMSAPNPFLAAVHWLRQRDVLAEVGNDPRAYREKILAEALADPQFLGRASEAARSFAAGQGRPRPSASMKPALPSLNRSASGASSAALIHDPSDQELYDEVMAGQP